MADSFVINGLFGPNGSILNLIDTVTVTTRSGDELSRTSDLALLANMMIPLNYGTDWKNTVGQMMGFGDAVYGKNLTRSHPLAKRRYSIPLYLLSPLFAYGRLLPAMLMSGLKIQITWHTAQKAFAQVVTRVRSSQNDRFINRGGTVGGYGHHATSKQLDFAGVVDPNVAAWRPHEKKVDVNNFLDIFQINQDETDQDALPLFFPTDAQNFWGQKGEKEAAPGTGLIFYPFFNNNSYGGRHSPGYQYVGEIIDLGAFYQTKSAENSNGSWIRGLRNPAAVTQYTILAPEFALCSVQLSDSIQRTLNEVSATEGLEIVYTDMDLTTSPVGADIQGASMYTEVRKSASRALGAYARIVPVIKQTAIDQCSDSNASAIIFAEDTKGGAKGWMDYQFQLGSLYFPQQKVTGKSAADFDPVAYAYTLEASKMLSGLQTCMLTLRGQICQSSGYTTVTQETSSVSCALNPYSAPPDILSQDRFYELGKPGSFCGGGHVLAVSLERSSLFQLSGIPINNSRVLAFRGTFSGRPTDYMTSFRLNIYLKYVKLARIFLTNVEVEQ